MNTSTSQTSTQDNPCLGNQTNTLFADILFISFITGSLGVGTILSLLSVPPLAPSLFLGSAVSLLVYRFLGEISPSDTTISVANLGKSGGTMASLELTTMVFNSAIEKQKISLTWSFAPRENTVVVLERDQGNPVPMNIDVESRVVLQKLLSY